MSGYDIGVYDTLTYDYYPGTKYFVEINDSELTRIKSFNVEKNLTQYSGKFSLVVSDPSNTLYDTVTSGDEIVAKRRADNKKIFGGFVEKIERDKEQRYTLFIDGGDYTTRLNDILVLAQVYNGREFSVIIRDIMNKYVMNTSIINNCDATTGWNETGATLTLETGNDTNDYMFARLGDGCLKLVPTATTITLDRTSASTKTFLATDYVTMYLYVEDASKVTTLSLDIGQDSSNYYNIVYTPSDLADGWNYVEFDLSTATTGAGTPALAGVDYYNLNIVLSDTTNTIYIDDFRQTPNGTDNYTLSNVSTTEYYTDIKYKNVTVFEAIKNICEIRPNTFDFYIDINKVLNFGIFGAIDSGQTLQRGVNVLKSEFWDDDTKLFNKVTVYGAKQEFNLTETFDGDGTEKEFVLTYEPITQSVSVGGVEKQGYVQGMSPTEYDYRVDKENRTIIFNTAPGAGSDNVSVNYTYGVPIIVQRQDDTSIANYKLRETKLENERLLTKTDVRIVAQEYIDAWANPILNAKFTIRINPEIDIGENVSVIDEKYFGDSVAREFGVVSLKHSLIGSRSGTELSLTQITKSVEMYLQDIFTRLNALEEKDKGDSDVLARLLFFSDSLGLKDDPSSNLIGTTYLINDSYILNNDINGILYDDDETAILSDFEDYTEWTSSGLTQTLSDDTTVGHYWVGTQGVKSTWTDTSGTGSITDTITSTDISSVTGVASGIPSQGTAGLWIYCADGSKISEIKIRLGSDSSNYKEYIAETYAQRNSIDANFTLYNKRNYLLFDLDDPDGTLGTVNWATITYLYVEWTVTGATNVTFDYLTVSKNNNIGLNGLGYRATTYNSNAITGQSI